MTVETLINQYTDERWIKEEAVYKLNAEILLLNSFISDLTDLKMEIRREGEGV